MASIGQLTVDLTMESASFLNAIKKAGDAAEANGKRIEAAMELAKGGIEAFAGAWSVEKIAETIDQSIEWGARMVDLSNKTGASTKAIQEFTFAMRQNGADTATAETSLGKFAQALGKAQNGNQSMAKLLLDLGVTSFKNYDQALMQVMEGMGKLPSQTQRAADATKLFGKAGGATAAIASQGADAYRELADEAEKYGIVIGGDVLKNSKEAEDKLSLLKQVIGADISGVILGNADAISHLADGLIKLVGALPTAIGYLDKFQALWAQASLDHPYLTGAKGLGEALGGHALPGLPGSAEMANHNRETLAGTAYGRQMLIVDQRKDFHDAVKAHGGNSAEANAALAALQKTKRMDRDAARAGQPKTVPIVNDAPPLKGPKAKKQKADNDNDSAYLRETTRYDKEINNAKQALATTIEDRNKLELDAIQQEHDDRAIQIAHNDKLGEDEKKKLQLLNDNLSDLQRQAANRKKHDDLVQQQLTTDETSLDIALQDAQSRESMAKTAVERRKIGEQILQIEYDRKRKELAAVLATDGASPAAKADAQKKLTALPGQQAADNANLKQQTMGPLEAWFDAIPKGAAQMKEALQGVEVDGLNKLSDGLMSVIEGTASVADAFKSMATSIIEDLLKIELEKEIIGPIANALFGAGSSGFLSSIIGHRANGGMTSAGTYEVGEHGPELVNIGSNANITANRNLASNDNGGGGLTISIGAITSNDPAAVQRMVATGIAQAMPLIQQQATDNTIKKLQRRTL